MNIVKVLGALLVLMFFASITSAQQSPPQEQVNEADAAQEKPVENKPKRSKAEPKEKVFRPSEEISEDLPVPFPIDI